MSYKVWKEKCAEAGGVHSGKAVATVGQAWASGALLPRGFP